MTSEFSERHSRISAVPHVPETPEGRFFETLMQINESDTSSKVTIAGWTMELNENPPILALVPQGGNFRQVPLIGVTEIQSVIHEAKKASCMICDWGCQNFVLAQIKRGTHILIPSCNVHFNQFMNGDPETTMLIKRKMGFWISDLYQVTTAILLNENALA